MEKLQNSRLCMKQRMDLRDRRNPMELQTIDIKDLIRIMDESPDDFIITVEGLDGGDDIAEEKSI